MTIFYISAVIVALVAVFIVSLFFRREKQDHVDILEVVNADGESSVYDPKRYAAHLITIGIEIDLAHDVSNTILRIMKEKGKKTVSTDQLRFITEDILKNGQLNPGLLD